MRNWNYKLFQLQNPVYIVKAANIEDDQVFILSNEKQTSRSLWSKFYSNLVDWRIQNVNEEQQEMIAESWKHGYFNAKLRV